MTKTFQTVELQNYKWQVVCVETGEVVQVCESKGYAIRMCIRLNRKFRKSAA